MAKGEDALQAALAHAVLNSLSEEERKDIFARALKDHLFYSSSDERSVLAQAFKSALDQACRELTAQLVEQHRTELVAVLERAFTKALSSGQIEDDWVARIAHVVKYGR